MPQSVLILEDDVNMQELLVETLEDHGYFSQGAGSADEAIQLARKFNFDLVVSDVRMAGTDGIDALAAIKRIRPDIRAIVITGYASLEAPARAMKVHVDDYIYKPFRLPDFLAAVRRVFQSGEERQGYQQLFSRVFSGSKKLLEMAGFSFRDTRLQALEGERDGTFQTFFVGVRSNHLKKSAALEIWDRIEELEANRQNLTGKEDMESLQRLQEAYRYACDLITAMSRSDSAGLGKARAPEQISRQDFYRFYDRIQDSSVSVEQLKVAPTLRRTDPALLNRSPEFAALNQRLWGAA
ncbi:MAG: response regulator [Armatimonadetes bacterium]|nr:response regulator [Armatimonadota bacterium]